MQRTIHGSFIFINKNGNNLNVYQQMNEQINILYAYVEYYFTVERTNLYT